MKNKSGNHFTKRLTAFALSIATGLGLAPAPSAAQQTAAQVTPELPRIIRDLTPQEMAACIVDFNSLHEPSKEGDTLSGKGPIQTTGRARCSREAVGAVEENHQFSPLGSYFGSKSAGFVCHFGTTDFESPFFMQVKVHSNDDLWMGYWGSILYSDGTIDTGYKLRFEEKIDPPKFVVDLGGPNSGKAVFYPADLLKGQPNPWASAISNGERELVLPQEQATNPIPHPTVEQFNGAQALLQAARRICAGDHPAMEIIPFTPIVRYARHEQPSISINLN